MLFLGIDHHPRALSFIWLGGVVKRTVLHAVVSHSLGNVRLARIHQFLVREALNRRIFMLLELIYSLFR